MKALKFILKVVSALAVVAGTVYVIATYGDKIVAWAKGLLANCFTCQKVSDIPAEQPEAPAAEEVPAAEEAPAEAPAEEAPAAVEEAPVAEEGEPVANEEDFEG